MKPIILFVFLSISGFSNSQVDSLLNFLKTTNVTELKESGSHIEFLNTMFQLDQLVRREEAENLRVHGMESNEYKKAVDKTNFVDHELFTLVQSYLKTHGHPKKELGEIPCYTPQLIFHHQPDLLEVVSLKKEYFHLFYQAYKNEALEENVLWFYLYRLHGQIIGHEYVSKLDETEQLEEMILRMDLRKEN